ncbi:hypothetical protein [Brevibacterium aurantiacum]|uniref:hypothetical protein n=1 Tax=Brevibacterium aurantiacum TaxID=273384 RepID=UPI001868BA69|nr:hypothetical protein [Brevibacterium aurantiacum]
MKTELGRRVRVRAATALTLTAGLSVPLLLSGCEDHSPVAAPTSTLPAKDSSTASPAADPQPTIPAYETDLDLSSEETEAVEGALVALDDFVAFTNALYESGGKSLKGVEKIATDESLDEVEKAAETMVDESTTMVGEVTIERITVSSIDIEQTVHQVSVQACSPSETYHFENPDNSAPAESDTSNPEFEFTIRFKEDSWKVAKQTWIREQCAS